MKKNVFESCPKYLGALTWNHPKASIDYGLLLENQKKTLYELFFKKMSFWDHFLDVFLFLLLEYPC